MLKLWNKIFMENNLNIGQIKQLKKDLEGEIFMLLSRFEEKAGVSVNQIQIRQVTVYNHRGSKIDEISIEVKF